MPLNIPERPAVVSNLEAYARAQLPDLDYSITKQRGYIGGLLKSLGSALHDWYVALKRYGDREPFPQTATREFLLMGWWADITELEPNPASAARGRVVVTGSVGDVLDAASEMEHLGTIYTVDNSVTVASITLRASSLTREDDTAIFETIEPHDLATGMTVVIAGAAEGAYNGTVSITVTAANEFTYAVSGSPSTPSAGTQSVTAVYAVASITATTTGSATNLQAGQAIAVSSPPAGIDSTARVTFGGVIDGSEAEDIEDFRERVLEALGIDYGMFSAAEIKSVAKQVPGVTRVWVREASLFGANGVNEGQVVIAFLRDDDANPIPSSLEAEDVKAHILTTIKPAHTADEDVMVIAPTAVAVDFTFTAIVPDTTSMRLAIRARLRQFFDEEVEFGETLTEYGYRCAILSTFDTERGQALKSFTLSAPSGDVAIAWNELPQLGSIGWL